MQGITLHRTIADTQSRREFQMGSLSVALLQVRFLRDLFNSLNSITKFAILYAKSQQKST